MSSRILVERDPHQTAVAVLEDDRLTEIFIERHRRRSIVGNLYKGRVTRVLPGMQAAFVDIGLERDAFLYVSDVADSGNTPTEEEIELDETRAEGFPVAPSITDLLNQGQELLVQVIKAPLPNKGARITTQVTLPGRYLVLLPTVRHFAVSRRIEEEQERQRLLELLEQLELEAGGLIVRTVGEGKGQAEFQADVHFLERLWRDVSRKAEETAAPAILHQDYDLALRTVRDLFNPEVEVLQVDGEEVFTRIVDFLDQVQPTLAGKVKLYSGGGSLFDRYRIPSQIEAALRSKVWLKSGGYLVINQTEALVAIDVNTGRYTGESNLEQTVLKTNLEAVEEVVRQIRLRDLGGIIVVDLIDMVEEEHREQVFAELEKQLARDRSKNKVLQISEFGLVEITRKRSRTNLERLLTRSCPHCGGSGRIRSVSTICLELRREVLRLRGKVVKGAIQVRAHPEVARSLQQDEGEILTELEREMGVPVLVTSDAELHHERYEIQES